MINPKLILMYPSLHVWVPALAKAKCSGSLTPVLTSGLTRGFWGEELKFLGLNCSMNGFAV